MISDARGTRITAASDGAAVAYDHVVEGYIGYRLDTADRLKRLLAVDPEMGLAHILRGYFAMMTFNMAHVPAAREALQDASRNLAALTPREQAHAAALTHWIDGRIECALATWEEILSDHPRDILAFRLHHISSFWRGRPESMLGVVERVLPHWSTTTPGYGAVLACRSFAHEECGDYQLAEAAGREAIDLDPDNIWAAHAVAHVLEMQGRSADGVLFIGELEPRWEQNNHLRHHLWWHRALFHLERREFAVVVDLYDHRFRDLESPLVRAVPDFYIDVQNAASMLFRLELRGIDVGGRWVELADKAEARTGDCLSAFTLPHWMMALAADERWTAAARLLDAIDAAAAGAPGDHAAVLGNAVLPICRAVLAHRRGDYAGAVVAMRPTLDIMHRLGGSYAQQDVLQQLFLDAALRADLADDARRLLDRIARRHPVPLKHRLAYADGARHLSH